MSDHDAGGDSLAAAWARRTAERLGIELVNLAEHPPPGPLVAGLLSEAESRELRALPLAFHDGQVTVAVVDPAAHDGGTALERRFGRPVRLVVAAADDLARAIDRRFPPEELHGEHETEDLRRSRLGDILIAHGAVSPIAIDAALRYQEQAGGRLGELLLHDGLIDEAALLRALARLHRLPAVDLGAVEPEPAALEEVPEVVQRELRIVPIAIREGNLLVAAHDRLDDDELDRLAEVTELTVQEALATPTQIDQLLQRLNEHAYSRTAVDLLQLTDPENSGSVVATTAQKLFFLLVAIAFVGCVVWKPILTLAVVFGLYSAFHLSVSLYKLRLILQSLGRHARVDVTDEEIAELDARTLPVYTILVPLFHEAAVIPRLVNGIHGLDYPRHKLDVRLLCEADDDETIDAIRALNLPAHFKLVIVPDSLPKTKPKACNFGMIQAAGEITVIYDAEDRPDPDQLKKVVVAFRKAPDDVVCIQGKLNYFNADQNLLTRWFTAEYSMWFDLMLPGLDAANAPIPLGGTSNHFRTDKLLELGAWDPYNVTEDADLGIRLARAGYHTAVVDSSTYEEANSDIHNWIRQRSRWIKGYFQTYLVHMRHPIRTFRQLGLRGFISFQLIVGGSLTFLFNPVSWFLTTLFTLTQLGFIREMFPGFVFYAAVAQLLVGNFVFTYANLAGTIHRGYFHLVRYALFTPIYWGFMSMAAWKGFRQLVTNPFYWEKTVHGLDASHAPALPASGPAPAAALAPAPSASATAPTTTSDAPTHVH